MSTSRLLKVFLASAFLVGAGMGAGLIAAQGDENPDDTAAKSEQSAKDPAGNDSQAAPEAGAGYLGVLLAPVPDSLRAHLSVEEGAMVRELAPGSPADKAGLRLYDVIVSVNGENLKTPEEVKSRIRSARAGEGLKIGVRRGGEKVSLDATLGSAPAEALPGTRPEKGPAKGENLEPRKDRDQRGFLGVGFGEIPQDLAFHLNLKDGAGVVVLDVTKGSPAEKAGIETRDVLVSVDGKEIDGPADFSRLMAGKKAGEEAKIDLIHRGEKKTVKASLTSRPRDLPWGMPPLGNRSDRFFWGPRAHKGRIILRGPDGDEQTFHIPDGFFKAKESAEDLFRDLEGKLGEFKDTQVPRIKEKLRLHLKDLERQLRDGEDDSDAGDGQFFSSEDRTVVLRSTEGQYDITVKEKNGLRTVTVKKGNEVIANDLPFEKLGTLPENVRAHVEKVGKNLESLPGRKGLRLFNSPLDDPLEGEKIRA